MKARWKSWAELVFSAIGFILLAWIIDNHITKQEWVWVFLDVVAMIGFYLMFSRAWREV